MKKQLILVFFIFSFSVANAATTIDTSKAPFYEGQEVIACGNLAQVTRFKRGLYLNMDAAFPRQSVSFVAWENDIADFNSKHGDLNKLINKRICGKGTVTQYRGRSQISLYNAFSLQVK